MRNITCFLTLIIFIGFGCGGVRDVCDCGVPDNYNPTVRLIKDTDRSFHFQWDSTLLEERIVLARFTYTNINWVREHWRTPTLVLHHFSPGAFRSGHMYVYDREFMNTQSVTVEILPAANRHKLKLPYPLGYRLSSAGDHQFGHEQVLVEHPFKHYEVGTPAKLTFSRKDKSQ